MSTLAAEMPKNPKTIKVEAHLMPDDMADFKLLAEEKQWSSKRLCENIVREYLAANKALIAKLKKKLDK